MTIFLVITLFACEGNKKNIQRLSITDNAPLAEGKNINLKYTDSGRVVYNLITPELKDYSNFEFGYQEFPKGVEVRFWDEENKKSTITSDYAINFINTELIDLRKNVVLKMSDSTVLRAEQLYWDKRNQWVFTNKPYQIKFKNGSFNDGARFDSNQEFTNFLSRNNQGVQIIEQENNGK
jgi:LPS export ABC transporter protein LptC